MTHVDVSGGAVPRLARREIAAFTRKVLSTLDKMERLERRVDEVCIAFVGDDAMRSLNRRFRRQNKTTDVLTFPGDDCFLGDIVISIDRARRQAATERHSLATEVRYLILHGLLHAFGYDHETDHGEMNALELDVRQAIGLT